MSEILIGLRLLPYDPAVHSSVAMLGTFPATKWCSSAESGSASTGVSSSF